MYREDQTTGGLDGAVCLRQEVPLGDRDPARPPMREERPHHAVQTRGVIALDN